MQQNLVALDVAEEARAEPGAFAGALDQARDVGEHEVDVAGAHDAEVWMQRRERIVGDLRLGGAHRCQERRLAGVGQADDAASAISFSRSQMVSSSPGWPGLAWRGAWLVDDLKCALPKPPLPPLAKQRAIAGLRPDRRAASPGPRRDLRARRHLDHAVLAVGAGAVLAHAVAAALGLEVLVVAVVDQRVEIVDACDPHVAAACRRRRRRDRRTR